MLLKFVKMHGLGNDFVVIDAVHQDVALNPELARYLADRHFGIGCDQILLIESPHSDDVDFRYRIFNADGGEVEQCGNGARCLTSFVHTKGLSNKQEIIIETVNSLLRTWTESNGLVTVDMGQPEFLPDNIPFIADSQADIYTLNLATGQVVFAAVSMGNPHAVICVDDVASAPVESVGALLNNDAHFPNGVNVGFMQITDRANIQLRVFERGAGETLACGTGACAAVVTGQQRGLLDNKVSVSLPGGVLQVSWEGPGESVYTTGPAVLVFEGAIEI